MKIIIDNMIRIQQPSDPIIFYCRDYLTLRNPDYSRKVRRNLWTGNTPQNIFLYQKYGTDVIVPFGCLRDVLDRMSDTDDYVVRIPDAEKVDFKCTIPLYAYQQRAVGTMIEAQYGILQSPAGSGKTQMGLAIASIIGHRTLWLTHTLDLLEQSKERAEKYMDSTLIGVIAHGQVEVGEAITFATVQTMNYLDLTQYKNVWDTIVVDECHRVVTSATSARMFAKVLNALSARHKYGLSATVHRADGLIAATFAMLGDVVHQVSETEVAEKITKVSIKPRTTSFNATYDILDTDGTIIYTKMINALANDYDRCEFILGDLIYNAEHYNLILSDRLAHLEYLMNSLPPDLREQAVMIDGKMSTKAGKESRKRAVEDLREGRKHYLFASYSLAREGLDIPRLDRLFLTTPQKDYAVVAQSVGRIARSFEGKREPVVYDYVDAKLQYLVRAYKKRCTTYRKLGCQFLE